MLISDSSFNWRDSWWARSSLVWSPTMWAWFLALPQTWKKKNPNPGQTPLFGFVVWFISNFQFILFKEEKLKMGFWRREEQVKDTEKHPEVDIPSDWNYFTHWLNLLVPSWYDLISSCITGPKFNFKWFFFFREICGEWNAPFPVGWMGGP